MDFRVKYRITNVPAHVDAPDELPGGKIKADWIRATPRLFELHLKLPQLTGSRYDFILVPVKARPPRHRGGIIIYLNSLQRQSDAALIDLWNIGHNSTQQHNLVIVCSNKPVLEVVMKHCAAPQKSSD